MTASCTTPVPFETLVALWAHELPEAEAEATELHLFSCDACAASSTRLARLVEGFQQQVPPVISRAHLDRMLLAGARIDVTAVRAEVETSARFAPELDLLVHALHGELAAADRVDLELVLPDGSQLMRFEHVPFDRAAGVVLIACQRHYRTAFPDDTRFRVIATEAGAPRQVGEYFIQHVWE